MHNPSILLDRLLIKLASISSDDGEFTDITDFENDIINEIGFRNLKHLEYYLLQLDNLSYIKLSRVSSVHVGNVSYANPLSIALTLQGWNRIYELNISGEHSNYCFIAMSFDEEDFNIYEILKKVCVECGYQPLRVDQINLRSDQTINDGIISLLNQSKFCIADFTKQKDGVYFEAGYAAGRGLKVIYTCRKDWWEKTHFDTNHFPHLIYDNFDELEVKLRNKILAWI